MRNPLDIWDVILQPLRRRIIEELCKKPSYISELAKRLDVERMDVVYHLSILERAGLIESRYIVLEEPTPKGRIGKYYGVNKEKLKEGLKEIEAELEKLKKIVE